MENIEMAQFRKNNIVKALENGDYVAEDGLIYCGKCHTPKQAEYNLGDRKMHLKILCACEEREQAEKARQEELEKHRAKIEIMRKTAFPESKMINWNFYIDDKTNAKYSAVAQNYVNNFEKMRENGKGLLYYGNVGVGKSFYAACIVNALVDKEYKCLMTNFSRLVNTITGMFQGKQEYIDNLNKYDLLVIDDLATERDTDFMNELVYTIIDSRYRAGLPIIVTTNLTGDEIINSTTVHKQRVFSRLMEMTIPVHIEGADRRKQKLADEFESYEKLLGL